MERSLGEDDYECSETKQASEMIYNLVQEVTQNVVYISSEENDCQCAETGQVSQAIYIVIQGVV